MTKDGDCIYYSFGEYMMTGTYSYDENTKVLKMFSNLDAVVSKLTKKEMEARTQLNDSYSSITYYKRVL